MESRYGRVATSERGQYSTVINTGLFFRGDSEGGNCNISILVIYFLPRKVSSFEHRINLLHIILSRGMSVFFLLIGLFLIRLLLRNDN